MPKSLYIDPNEVRRPKEHKIKFPEIPVMQYKKSVADEHQGRPVAHLSRHVHHP